MTLAVLTGHANGFTHYGWDKVRMPKSVFGGECDFFYNSRRDALVERLACEADQAIKPDSVFTEFGTAADATGN